MILFKRKVELELEVLDASKAMGRAERLVSWASKVPFVAPIFNRKVEAKIEEKLESSLTPEALEKIALQKLKEEGIEARIKVKVTRD